MRLTAFVIVLTVFAGSALALPAPGAHPAQACSDADAQLDGAFASSWYESCAGQTDGGSTVAISYTQTLVSCTSDLRSCTYLPHFHVDLSTLGAGDWIARASSHETKYPGNAMISGSQRSVECRVLNGANSCDATVDNRQVVGDNFNSARWVGSWSLFFVDAQGAEHLMSTGGGNGWLAQYCNCEG